MIEPNDPFAAASEENPIEATVVVGDAEVPVTVVGSDAGAPIVTEESAAAVEAAAPHSIVEEVIDELKIALLGEHSDIKERYHKLVAFMRSEAHERLHAAEKTLLQEQAELLHKLADVIERRAARL